MKALQQHLEALVDQELGVSTWFPVCQEDIDVFARMTGDEDPLHNDPVWAASGPYEGTIAHGFFVLSILGKFSKEVGIPGSTTSDFVALNYGLNKVRFLAPVPVGRRIRARVKLIDVAQKGSGLLIASANAIEVEGSDQAYAYAELLTFLAPQANEPAS